MSTLSRVYSNVRGLQAAIKDAGRLREIAAILAKHGFGEVVTRLELTEAVGIRRLMAYRDEADRPFSTAQRVRMTLEELGPTFIKLGQILSTRADLLGDELTAELARLQDDAPPLPWEEVRAEVERELGAPIFELFAEFDQRPLACASIAHVHAARLPDGTPVVVKVQRPAIARTIESDLSILHFLARRAADAIPELRSMNPVGVVEEFDKAIRREIDFSFERHHTARFRASFEDFEGVHVPAVFPRLSTAKVLTMERIEGVKITEAPETLAIDPYLLAPRLLRMLFQMVLRHGFFHGDLHPGNILVAADGTIGLIDFGLVGRLAPEQSDAILDILAGIARPDYRLVARTFFGIGLKAPGVRYDYASFEADVVEIMERHVAGRTLGEIDVCAFLADLIRGAVRHRIAIPQTYTMVFKALMTVEGIGKTLAPEVSLIDEARPFVREMLLERYSPQRLLREAGEAVAEASRFLRQLPQTANRVLQEAEEGRLTLRVELRELAEAAERQRRGSSLVARSIAFGSCAVAGALAADPTAALPPGPLAIGLFALAGLFGFRLALGALRSE